MQSLRVARLGAAGGTCFRPRRSALSRKHVCAAEPETDKSKEVDKKVVEDTVRELRRVNVDQTTAKEILDVWKTNGITDDPEQLRQLYSRKSNSVLARFAVQLLLDAGACYAAYSASSALSSGDSFFGRNVLVFVFACVTFNYAIAFMSNMFSMYVSIQSMSKFGVNAAAYLEAIKTIAGPNALDSVSKAVAAIDGYKISQALEKMDTYLKERASSDECRDGSGGGATCTLDSLAVYLTLNKARELYGFDEEKMGLTDKEAIDIARMFSKYDTNDDYQLDLVEFEKLCADAGRELSRAEAQAALNVIDENGNGYIDFVEFSQFWKDPQSKAQKAAIELASPPEKVTAAGSDSATADAA